MLLYMLIPFKSLFCVSVYMGKCFKVSDKSKLADLSETMEKQC